MLRSGVKVFTALISPMVPMLIRSSAGTPLFSYFLARLSVQAFHDTGFALQEPLSGKAVVLVQYPAVRHRLPQAARQYLDGWFAHSTAPPPPELGVHLVPCRSIHGQSMLPALPAALQLGKDRAGGLLAAFCCPTPPDPAWELLYGEDAAQLLL